MGKQLTTEEFIKKAREIHGDKYDYSKVNYVNTHTKVCIICPIHGEFLQTPNTHLSRRNCPKCSHRSLKKTTEEFIFEAKKVHGDKYDYSKVEYINNSTKVCIICPEHGEFWQTPSSHLQGKSGCPLCANKKVHERCNKGTEQFIKEAIKVHGDKYDYTKSSYVTAKKKIMIICPKHGEFWQKPTEHLTGRGCPKCAGRNKTIDDFIKMAKEIHGDKYDYSKVDTTSPKSKVTIICPIHGEFKQCVEHHLNGHGCPICKESTLEKEIRELLIENNLKFEEQKMFDWLKYKGNLRLDFYLPDYNIAIECQGEQHFKIIDFFGGEAGFKNTIERDKRKRELCKQHNINILYVNYNEIDYKEIIKNYFDNYATN